MIEALTANYPIVAQGLVILGAVYSLATAIAAVTPTDKDDKFLSKVGRIADRIGIQLKTPKE